MRAWRLAWRRCIRRVHAPLTADGEAFDETALAAAHQTSQLPAIVRVTNLENGLQTVVRLNDRGPATPHRLIEVTRGVATLLHFGRDDGVRVRVQVLPAESHAAVDAVPGAPTLDIAAAPVGAVQQTDLPPPGGAVLASADTTVPRHSRRNSNCRPLGSSDCRKQ